MQKMCHIEFFDHIESSRKVYFFIKNEQFLLSKLQMFQRHYYYKSIGKYWKHLVVSLILGSTIPSAK
jgi:hypothetical protein